MAGLFGLRPQGFTSPSPSGVARQPTRAAHYGPISAVSDVRALRSTNTLKPQPDEPWRLLAFHPFPTSDEARIMPSRRRSWRRRHALHRWNADTPAEDTGTCVVWAALQLLAFGCGRRRVSKRRHLPQPRPNHGRDVCSAMAAGSGCGDVCLEPVHHPVVPDDHALDALQVHLIAFSSACFTLSWQGLHIDCQLVALSQNSVFAWTIRASSPLSIASFSL